MHNLVPESQRSPSWRRNTPGGLGPVNFSATKFRWKPSYTPKTAPPAILLLRDHILFYRSRKNRREHTQTPKPQSIGSSLFLSRVPHDSEDKDAFEGEPICWFRPLQTLDAQRESLLLGHITQREPLWFVPARSSSVVLLWCLWRSLFWCFG